MVPYRPYPPPQHPPYYPPQQHPPYGWANPASFAPPPPAPPKKRGFGGLVLAALALTLVGTCGYGVKKVGREREAKLAAANEKLAGKVDAAQIDAATACVLLEKEITLGLYPRTRTVTELKCTGGFAVEGKRALLEGVEMSVGGKKQMLTACFARGSRWFGLAVLDGATAGASCPAGDFDVPAHGTPPSEAELLHEEAGIRAELARKAEAAELAKLETFLARVEANVDAYEPTRKACPTIDRAATAATVDFEYLHAPADTRDTRENWSFMTSKSVRQGLDRRNDAATRGKAAHAIFGSPYLVVFEAEDRQWPEVGHKRILRGRDLWSGSFDGWMHLVDTQTGRPVCSTALGFKTSAKLKTRSDDPGTLMRVMKADLEDQFHKQSAHVLGGLVGNALTLER